jgi:hypothetical protein
VVPLLLTYSIKAVEKEREVLVEGAAMVIAIR